jgi:hypothetical protein
LTVNASILGDHTIENMILRHIIQEFGPSEGTATTWFTLFRVMDRHGHETLGVGVREGLHENILENAEDCRRRSDPQSEREYRDYREAGSRSYIPQPISNVLSEFLHGVLV